MIRFPLLLVLFLAGLALLLGEWLTQKLFMTHMDKLLLKRDNELMKLKAEHFDADAISAA